MEIVGKPKEDVSLPKATMTKIIKEMLPAHARVTKDAQELLADCCMEFINLIASESNEICYRDEKRTIAPEHVLESLRILGFDNYTREVAAAHEQHKVENWDCARGGTRWSKEKFKMSEEEALLEQQRMFAEARARMNMTDNIIFQNSHL